MTTTTTMVQAALFGARLEAAALGNPLSLLLHHPRRWTTTTTLTTGAAQTPPRDRGHSIFGPAQPFESPSPGLPRFLLRPFLRRCWGHRYQRREELDHEDGSRKFRHEGPRGGAPRLRVQHVLGVGRAEGHHPHERQRGPCACRRGAGVADRSFFGSAHRDELAPPAQPTKSPLLLSAPRRAYHDVYPEPSNRQEHGHHCCSRAKECIREKYGQFATAVSWARGWSAMRRRGWRDEYYWFSMRAWLDHNGKRRASTRF